METPESTNYQTLFPDLPYAIDYAMMLAENSTKESTPEDKEKYIKRSVLEIYTREGRHIEEKDAELFEEAINYYLANQKA